MEERLPDIGWWLRTYWISRCKQPTGCGRLAWVLCEVLTTPESINLHVAINLTKPQTWTDILARPNFSRSSISSLETSLDGVDRNHLGGNLGFQGCVIEGFVLLRHETMSQTFQ
jgi:hypothetical protein